ncbi:MAG: tRNA (adenosine(37)-N6)-threonylcarbamoyltransferase complex ATPase subunit type 1 TsaE [Patescibacteria group bacterium]
MEKVIRSLEELQNEAASFMVALIPSSQGATLVTLSGELGAGKTAFVKAVAKVLGVDETVTSPTFVLEKIYILSRQSFKRLIHIDAYRLEKESDLAPLGFNELVQDTNNLILFEWPEKVIGALPSPAVKVSLAACPDGSHTISYG